MRLLVRTIRAISIALNRNANTSRFRTSNTLIGALIRNIRALRTSVLREILRANGGMEGRLNSETAIGSKTQGALDGGSTILLERMADDANITDLTILDTNTDLLIFRNDSATRAAMNLSGLTLVTSRMLTKELDNANGRAARRSDKNTRNGALSSITSVLGAAVDSNKGARTDDREEGTTSKSDLEAASNRSFLNSADAATTRTGSRTVNADYGREDNLLPNRGIADGSVGIEINLLSMLSRLSLMRAITLTTVRGGGIGTDVDGRLGSTLVFFANASDDDTSRLLKIEGLEHGEMIGILHRVTTERRESRIAVLIRSERLSLLQKARSFINLNRDNANENNSGIDKRSNDS